MKRKSHTKRRLHHTNPTLRYGGALAPKTKSTGRPRFKQTIRVSGRTPVMDRRAKEMYDHNCYFFSGNPTPTIRQIKDRFRCTRNARKKYLYAQDPHNNDQYNYIPQTYLTDHSCLTNYNNYFNKEEEPLTFDSLCDAGFRDINPDYDDLIAYAYELETHLGVDPLIKEFIMKLITYTNINREGLKEIYNGAFVVIQDNGFFYDSIVKDKKNSDKLRECITKKTFPDSSHDSVYNAPQYRLGNGIIYDCSSSGACDMTKANSTFDCLIGKSIIPDLYGNTWFQFEYANLLGFWNKIILHGYSYIKHKLSGKNVGPLGNSDYAEYVKPLILSVCGCDDKSRKCVPFQCVRRITNLHEYSATFLSTANLSLPDYSHLRLKNFISSAHIIHDGLNIDGTIIDDAYTMSIAGLYYSVNYELHTSQINSIVPYVDMLQKQGNQKRYDINIIQEIVFLLFYYAIHNNRNYDEIMRTIRSKYFTDGIGSKRSGKSRKSGTK